MQFFDALHDDRFAKQARKPLDVAWRCASFKPWEDGIAKPPRRQYRQGSLRALNRIGDTARDVAVVRTIEANEYDRIARFAVTFERS